MKPSVAPIAYSIAPSPLGPMLVASTGRGVCAVAFARSEPELMAELEARFPGAPVQQADLPEVLGAVQAALAGESIAPEIVLDLPGTPFQQRVWRELRRIPRGQTRTYSQLAQAIGAPQSVRAVAGACAANPLAVLVPCHRVIGKSGALTGYRWGTERKRALLELEARCQ